MQPRRATRAAQAMPPFDGFVMTERVLERMPPPQPSLHSVQTDQADSLQSAGHAQVLHLRCLVLVPSHWPPLAAGTRMERLLVCEPVEQLAVHTDHPDHADQTQSCVGEGVGKGVGSSVGHGVGKAVGDLVGEGVGKAVGNVVGSAVG